MTMKTRDFGKSCVDTSDLKAVQITATEDAKHLGMVIANTADV